VKAAATDFIFYFFILLETITNKPYIGYKNTTNAELWGCGTPKQSKERTVDLFIPPLSTVPLKMPNLIKSFHLYVVMFAFPG